MNYSHPDHRNRLDMLAAQYALGTLPGRARARLARAARSDADVARAIADWERRLAGLADAAPPVTPPPRVWQAIVARLGLARSGEAASARSWWSGVPFWRGLALASFAAVIALGVTQYNRSQLPGGEAIVVVMAGQDQKPVLVAAASQGGRVLRVKAVTPIAIPGDRALELWMIEGSGNPVSLGLIDATGTATLTLSAPVGTVLAGMSALAVSLEAAGGSPTGKPQGPVLYSGAIQQI